MTGKKIDQAEELSRLLECEADPLTVEVAAALAELRGRFTDARQRAAAWTLPPYPGDE